MKLLDIFRNFQKKETTRILEEVEANVKVHVPTKSSFIEEHEFPAFSPIDTTPFIDNPKVKTFMDSLEQRTEETPKNIRLIRDAAYFKINSLPAPTMRGLTLLGYSKIDGYPCFMYTGNDIGKLLQRYELEELHIL